MTADEKYLSKSMPFLCMLFLGGLTSWFFYKFVVGRRTMQNNFRQTQEMLENLQAKLEQHEKIRNSKMLEGGEIEEVIDEEGDNEDEKISEKNKDE